MTLPSDSGYCFRFDGELWSWVIDIISLDYLLLLEHVNLYPWNLSNLIYIMCLRICLSELCIVFCMHTFHAAHICMVFNSVKCVHYFYLQVNSWIITYLSHCLNLQPILCIVHWTHWILDFKYILLLLLLSCVHPLFWSPCVCCMWVWGRESVTVVPGRCLRGVWCCAFAV